MLHSMDPGGTDRIVKRRHEEWYSERQRDRQAALLDSPTRERGMGILAAAGHRLAALVTKAWSIAGTRIGHPRAPTIPDTVETSA